MKLWKHDHDRRGRDRCWRAATLTAQAIINGAGATFPNPIYQKWFAEYNKLHADVRINYQPVGSGGGVQQVSKRTVFFGASDQPMTPEQLLAANGKILHFPTVLGGVVPIYNIPGVTRRAEVHRPAARRHLPRQGDEVERSGDRQSERGRLAAQHRHRRRPPIGRFRHDLHLRRLPGQGVARVEDQGRRQRLAATGRPASAARAATASPARCKQTPGSIGYTELTYALTNKISYGAVQNAAGKFVKASTESVTAAAAAAAAKMPADFRVSITNAPGDGAYPLSSFTWLLLYESPADKAQAKTMVEFMTWALNDGQKFAPDMGYAPLPKAVVDLELAALKKIKTQ